MVFCLFIILVKHVVRLLDFQREFIMEILIKGKTVEYCLVKEILHITFYRTLCRIVVG